MNWLKAGTYAKLSAMITTWSEHQYQTADMVRPNTTPVHGNEGSSMDRNKWKEFRGGRLQRSMTLDVRLGPAIGFAARNAALMVSKLPTSITPGRKCAEKRWNRQSAYRTAPCLELKRLERRLRVTQSKEGCMSTWITVTQSCSAVL